MAVGSVQWVIVCQVGLPAGTVGSIVGPPSRCTDGQGVVGLPVAVKTYVLDASQQDFYEGLRAGSQVGGSTGGSGGSGSLLDLSPEQAGPVAAAVFGVWAAAWVAKQAIRTLRGSDEKID
jgi:hypothetical protein